MQTKARKPRSDKGPRLTARDLNALKWIAQQYAISLDHLCILLARLIDYQEYAQQPKESGEVTVSRANKVIKRWEQLGLIERGHILYGDPVWVWLTPEGLRTVNQELGPLCPYAPTPGKINHLYWINHARLYIEQQRDDIEWLSERQIHANQKSEPGVKQKHTPDAIVSTQGQAIALEVELATKTYARLDKVLHELALSDYHTIWYFTLGRAKQVIESAIENMNSMYKHRFVIYDMDDLELQ
ncbi:hypothetical protein KSF_098860 [Reticulibacter mediterranei]|uniref:Replication-relaxation n=2 Tax=Reticulibacter mediterranei TaxID=2778369 RepID=A0A8J3IWK6_9CHLR|nr:hypothetical protein KSF_098860 [Reticulibacter mediterranei]